MPSATRAILIVDDSQTVRTSMAALLAAAGYATHEAADGPGGLALLAAHRIDLVLLDIQMPGLSGFDTLKQMRLHWQGPVIMLSGIEETVSKVRALDSGADDYVVKPVEVSELLARVRANLRRPPRENGSVLTLGALRIEAATGQVRKGERRLRLSQMETSLLLLLIRREGRSMPSAEIAIELWGRDDEHTRHNLRVLMRKLRLKVEENPDMPRLLLTDPQTGYRIGRGD